MYVYIFIMQENIYGRTKLCGWISYAMEKNQKYYTIFLNALHNTTYFYVSFIKKFISYCMIDFL